MSYQGTDFYLLDKTLFSFEELSIRDSIRGWVEKSINPIIAKAFEDNKFPTEVISQMAEMGMFGPTLPEQFGGLGINNVAYGLMM